MFKRIALAAVLIAVAIPALAQVVGVEKQTETWVNCTTSSTVLLARDPTRTSVAIWVSSGAAYIHSAPRTTPTEAATSANSIRLDTGAAWNNEVGTVFVGAWTCLGDGGTARVNVVTRP